MPIRVGMVSLGCSKNLVDSERMLFKLRKHGYTLVKEPGDADVVVVNTCGFIQSAKEEAIEKFGIRIGEPVVPDVTFTYSETTDLMVGKSFDCRLGCAAILKTMHTLAGQELNVDIVGACAAQEEVGVRGATVTAQVIKPDIAIVFEGCPADDTCV